MKRMKIGVVEDNEDNRLLLHAFLDELYKVVDFEDGPAALDGLPAASPDLILLDISLPGMDGVEVLEQIRLDGRLRHLPVIALTAHAMSGDRERLLAAGFDEYISKPIVDEGVLLEAIARLLDRKRGTPPVAVPARTCVEPAKKAEAGCRVAVAS
ncbi:MAG: response regulator [Planctomycetota bacterium]|nr:response regulator [Planctomycetota bacterium]